MNTTRALPPNSSKSVHYFAWNSQQSCEALSVIEFGGKWASMSLVEHAGLI